MGVKPDQMELESCIVSHFFHQAEGLEYSEVFVTLLTRTGTFVSLLACMYMASTIKPSVVFYSLTEVGKYIRAHFRIVQRHNCKTSRDSDWSRNKDRYLGCSYGVMVIFVSNRLGYLSSNPDETVCISHCPATFSMGKNLAILSTSLRKLLVWLGCLTFLRGEEKLWNLIS